MRHLSTITLGFFLSLSTIGISSVFMVGCGPKTPPTAEPVDQVVAYTVRGRITEVPEEGRPASEFAIRHEPIPSFLSGGEVVGMASMTMPFPLKEGVSIDGLSVGQAVEMTFEVTYDHESKSPINVQATKITPLPKDTVLVFEHNDESAKTPMPAMPSKK